MSVISRSGCDLVHALEPVLAVVGALDAEALRGQRRLEQHAHARQIVDR